MRTPRAIIGLTLVAALGLSACGGGDDEKLSSGDRAKASAAALKYVGGGAVTDTERGDGDDGYAYGVEVTLPGGTDIDVELDTSFTVTNSPAKASDLEPSAPQAGSTSSPAPKAATDDRPLTGSTLTKATAAALEATGDGKVTETSGSDDTDHEYEVEVLLPSGADVTVELDRDFKVTRIDR